MWRSLIFFAKQLLRIGFPLAAWESDQSGAMLRLLIFSIGLATIAGIPVSLTQPKLANLVGVSDSLISEVNGDANSTW
jgi:hypothetical protein